MFDRWVIAVLLIVAAALAGRAWLEQHPEHNPYAPLDLRDPPGWATAAKLRQARQDGEVCRAVLERSEVSFEPLPAAGEGACYRPDRLRLSEQPLRPEPPPTTCAVALGLERWLENANRVALARLDSEIRSVRHLGAYSCRRLYGRSEGAWSEHATGNAIDIAGFTLEDGTEISVLADWNGSGVKATFLREARNAACDDFATVLGPDYNAAHRDHFHFDQAARWGGVCR